MALPDFGKIKNSVQGAADAVKTSVKDIKKPEIKVPEIKTPNFKVPDISALKQVKERIAKKTDKPADAKASSDVAEESGQWSKAEVKGVHIGSAIEIMYFLMSADGEMEPREEEAFNEMGSALLEDFEKHKEIILTDCRKQLENPDQKPLALLLAEAVDHALILSENSEGYCINSRHLIWNLLTIANSDRNYASAEQELIRYTADRLHIDKAVVSELESSMATIMDLDKEVKWIKTTDRPYLTIEAMVNEIADRKNVIFGSVKDLITM